MDTIHIEKRTFPVLDMSCAACAARVDKTLNGQPGVRTASVNYAAATATVEYDTAQCSPEQLKAALQAAGYDLLVGDDRKQLEDRAEQAHDEKYRRLRQRTVWAIVLALPVAVIGLLLFLGRLRRGLRLGCRVGRAAGRHRHGAHGREADEAHQQERRDQRDPLVLRYEPSYVFHGITPSFPIPTRARAGSPTGRR